MLLLIVESMLSVRFPISAFENGGLLSKSLVCVCGPT